MRICRNRMYMYVYTPYNVCVYMYIYIDLFNTSLECQNILGKHMLRPEKPFIEGLSFKEMEQGPVGLLGNGRQLPGGDGVTPMADST